MSERQLPEPSTAVAAMLRQDGELDRLLEGRGLLFDRTPAPVVQPAQPFVIEPFDTSSFVDRPPEPTNRPAEADEPPPAPTYPAPTTRSRRWGRRTP